MERTKVYLTLERSDGSLGDPFLQAVVDNQKLVQLLEAAARLAAILPVRVVINGHVVTSVQFNGNEVAIQGKPIVVMPKTPDNFSA